MARARVTCICSTCGAEFEKIKRGCYNRAAANSWEEWARENIDECPECYKKRRREEEAEKGLLVSYSVDQYAAKKGKLVFKALFSGNSYNRREELKAFGCKWDGSAWVINLPAFFEKDDADGKYGFTSEGKTLKERIENELGAKMIEHPSRSDISCALKCVLKAQVKEKEKQEELEELGQKPEYPHEFMELCSDKRWNGTVYGGKNKSVYLDGEKVELSAELAAEILKVQEERKTWKIKKDQILNKYMQGGML